VRTCADGSVRDSLSLVEQATAFGEGAVRQGEVESMLGRVSTTRLLDLLEALANQQAAVLFEQVDALADYAPDYAQLLGELISLLHRVALLQTAPASVDKDTPGIDRLVALAQQIAADEVQLFYQIGVHARRDMAFAPDPREAFDMALLRMLTFAPQGESISVSSNTVGSPEKPALAGAPAATATPKATPTTANAPAGTAAPTAVPAHAPSAAPAAEAAAASAPTPAEAPVPAAALTPGAAPAVAPLASPAVTPGAAPAVTPVPPSQSPAGQAGAPAASAPAAPDPTPAPAQIELSQLAPENWSQTVKSLGLAGMPLQLADNCAFGGVVDNVVTLQLETSSEHLNTPRFAQRLQTALGAYTGKDVKLRIDMAETELNTPARQQVQRKNEALQDAKQSIENDPLLQQLVAEVDGVVDPNSIKPVKRVDVSSADE